MRSVAIGRRGVIIMWGVTAGSRATTQIMLGLSVRARWDATLVNIIKLHEKCHLFSLKNNKCCLVAMSIGNETLI